MLKEYIPASRAVFETNLDYFEKGKKFVQEIMAILDKDQPLVPLCIRYQHYVTQPYLEGWENFGDGNGHFGFADIVNAWLNK